LYCVTGRRSEGASEPPATGAENLAGGAQIQAGGASEPAETTDGRGGREHLAGRGEQPIGLRSAVRWLLGRGQAVSATQPHAMDGGTGSGESATLEELVAPELQVSRLLRQAAAWSWCLLLTAAAIYLTFRLLVALRLVVLPFMAALLFTALLQPFTMRLHRIGMPKLAATWCAFLLALLIIAGAITLFANRVSADYPTLFAEVQRTTAQVQRSLAGPPFHLSPARLQQLGNDVVKFISQHKSQVAGTVVTGGKYALEFLTGVVVALFMSFFLLKDGPRIWFWLISGLRPEAKRRVGKAGDAAWRALVNYVRGTTAVAAIHSLFLGLAFWLLGLPLLVPFIVLVFIAAFVPIIGILVVGALAILVALATKGWVAAVILLAVLIVENQIEGHLLQPLVVGRIVRLHPLAIIVVLAVGAIIAGIPGAIIAVPITAVISYAWPALRGPRPGD
jgi:predicted PurR-regulated permease PerM